MSSLDRKVIAVTGAGSGIGLATAHLLASRGAVLTLADVNADALANVAASLPNSERHISQSLDVRSFAAVDAWIASSVARLGKLDGAANIAGVLGAPKAIRDSSEEDWDFVMNINAKGVYNCLKAELKHVKQGKDGIGGGSIVNFASIAGLVALPDSGLYTVSKHAVVGLSRAVARDEGIRGVRVNCVAPGMTRTPIVAGVQEEELRRRTKRFQCIDRIADPEEIAKVVAFLLSDDSSFVTGACYEVSGGWTA